jgi:NAD(P)-dependent dehydrogenase (short-subunit alcohol dehydrogenase family)
MDIRFDGKVVLVTGASSGIGREIALAFGASGARTALNGFRHFEAAEQAAQKIRGEGGTASAPAR